MSDPFSPLRTRSGRRIDRGQETQSNPVQRPNGRKRQRREKRSRSPPEESPPSEWFSVAEKQQSETQVFLRMLGAFFDRFPDRKKEYLKVIDEEFVEDPERQWQKFRERMERGDDVPWILRQVVKEVRGQSMN